MEKNVKQKTKKILYKFLILCGIFFLCAYFFLQRPGTEKLNFQNTKKNVALDDAGVEFETTSDARTVGDFLKEQNVTIKSDDVVFPAQDAKIFSGMKVTIMRSKNIIIKDGTNTMQVSTLLNTIEQAIWENKNIDFDQDDITVPARNTPIADGETIIVTHVVIKQEIVDQDIAFKIDTNNDDTLGWRITKITQPGVKGILENSYKVVYNNGKEISRKLLTSNVTQQPTDQIVTQGTYVKTGKASVGAASWYAFTGTLAAANPWLPLGSYARVTNQDNGKSVIVKINDRGPFVGGRIMDLDKVAFEQIADLGQGTANIKMEPILN